MDLSDDSEFAFKVLAGSFEISLYDRLGFTADPTDSVVVDPDSNVVDFNILQYARFNNSAGILVTWDMNVLTQFVFAFDRNDMLPLDSEFDTTRRTSNTISARGSYLLNKDLTIGVNSSISTSDYNIDFQKRQQRAEFGRVYKLANY